MKATYTRLRSGGWGVRVEGDRPAPGAEIAVLKKNGAMRREKVATVVWSDDQQGLHLCTLADGRPENSNGNGHAPAAAPVGPPWVAFEPREVEKLHAVARRLFSEDRLDGDAMRDLAQTIEAVLRGGVEVRP